MCLSWLGTEQQGRGLPEAHPMGRGALTASGCGAMHLRMGGWMRGRCQLKGHRACHIPGAVLGGPGGGQEGSGKHPQESKHPPPKGRHMSKVCT